MKIDEALHAIEQTHIQPIAIEALPWHLSTIKFHRIVHPGEALSLQFDWRSDGQVHFELRSSQALVASGTAKRRAHIRAVVSAR